jgi:hypothetical protein
MPGASPAAHVQIAKEVAAAVRAAAPRVAELDRKRKADLAGRLTARWQRWELSNFDYLMQLNTLAGARVAFMRQEVHAVA